MEKKLIVKTQKPSCTNGTTKTELKTRIVVNYKILYVLDKILLVPGGMWYCNIRST